MELKITNKDIKRFYKKIRFCDSGCWEWLGEKIYRKNRISSKPDLRFVLGNQKIQARRFGMVFFGKVNEDTPYLGNSCKNPLCVNPVHSEHFENTSVNLTFRTKKRRKISQARISQIIQLRKVGLTLCGISVKTKISLASVIMILKMAKLCREGKLYD